MSMQPHYCHLPGCKTPVPLRLLMCREHWKLVPSPIQRAVYAAYRPGQEVDKAPSRQWIAAAESAIAAVQHALAPNTEEDRCGNCGGRTMKRFQVQRGINGDEQHSIPLWRSEWTVHGDDLTLAGKAYCERTIAHSAPKRKAKRA